LKNVARGGKIRPEMIKSKDGSKKKNNFTFQEKAFRRKKKFFALRRKSIDTTYPPRKGTRALGKDAIPTGRGKYDGGRPGEKKGANPRASLRKNRLQKNNKNPRGQTRKSNFGEASGGPN